MGFNEKIIFPEDLEFCLRLQKARYKILWNNEMKILSSFRRIKKTPLKDLLKRFLAVINIFLGKNPNYQKYNDMTGVLIRCSKEIKRRLGFELPGLIEIMKSYDEEIADYEDEKIKENGDV